MSLLTLIACVLIADFLTGLIHWWEDTYGDPRWPTLGPEVIRPNIEHHRTPNAIGRMGDFIGRNWQPAALSAVAWVVIMALGTVLGWPFTWASPIALTLAMAGLGNEVHTWSHRAPTPFTAFLQDTGLVQHPRQHARHHKPPYDRYYCTLTNVVNAILEPLRFWRGLEWAISSVTGIRPRRGSPEREGF